MDFERWYEQLGFEGRYPKIVHLKDEQFPTQAYFNSIKRAMKLAYREGVRHERYKNKIKRLSKI